MPVDHTSDNLARGYAFLTFASEMDRHEAIVPLGSRFQLAVGDERVLELSITPCDDPKICRVIPQASHHQRQRFQLDPEGFFSISSEETADDMTESALAILGSKRGMCVTVASSEYDLVNNRTDDCWMSYD